MNYCPEEESYKSIRQFCNPQDLWCWTIQNNQKLIISGNKYYVEIRPNVNFFNFMLGHKSERTSQWIEDNIREGHGLDREIKWWRAWNKSGWFRRQTAVEANSSVEDAILSITVYKHKFIKLSLYKRIKLPFGWPFLAAIPTYLVITFIGI